MHTAVRGPARGAYFDDIVSVNRNGTENQEKNAGLVGPLTVKLRKQAMGFVKNAGLCSTCRFFEWVKIGSKNRCKAGDFANASRHGCKFYQHE